MASVLKPDTRAAQMERVASFLERNPGATLKLIESACDTGSVTKVVSVMRASGYRIKSQRIEQPCNNWRNARKVACYWLLSRPASSQGDLFTST